MTAALLEIVTAELHTCNLSVCGYIDIQFQTLLASAECGGVEEWRLGCQMVEAAGQTRDQAHTSVGKVSQG